MNRKTLSQNCLIALSLSLFCSLPAAEASLGYTCEFAFATPEKPTQRYRPARMETLIPVRWEPTVLISGHEKNASLPYPSAVLSPDRSLLALRSAHNALMVFDLTTGQRLFEKTISNFEVMDFSFSADNKKIVVISWDNSVTLLDAHTGSGEHFLRSNDALNYARRAANFVLNGRELITESYDGINDHSVIRREKLDASNPAVDEIFRGAHMRFAVPSPGGSKIAVSFYMELGLFLIDAHSQSPLLALEDSARHPYLFPQFSPNGRLVTALALRGNKEEVPLWDTRTGKRVRTIRGHRGDVTGAVFTTGVVFTPDSERVITASQDKTIRIWSTRTGVEIGRLEGHGDGVIDQLSLSNDGAYLLTTDTSHKAILWDLDKKRPVTQFFFASGPELAHAFLGPDGRSIISVSRQSGAKIWKPTYERRAQAEH